MWQAADMARSSGAAATPAIAALTRGRCISKHSWDFSGGTDVARISAEPNPVVFMSQVVRSGFHSLRIQPEVGIVRVKYWSCRARTPRELSSKGHSGGRNGTILVASSNARSC